MMQPLPLRQIIRSGYRQGLHTLIFGRPIPTITIRTANTLILTSKSTSTSSTTTTTTTINTEEEEEEQQQQQQHGCCF